MSYHARSSKASTSREKFDMLTSERAQQMRCSCTRRAVNLHRGRHLEDRNISKEKSQYCHENAQEKVEAKINTLN